MPGMPGNISKGPILKEFDQVCNAPGGADSILQFYEQNDQIDEWLEKAGRGGNNWGVFAGRGGRQHGTDSPGAPRVPREHDETHVRRHWFGIGAGGPGHGNRQQKDVWWPELHRMDDVMMEGLKKALRLCLYDLVQSPARLQFDQATNIIRRDSGSWVGDGFGVGNTIRIARSQSNNQLFTATAVTATDLTVNGPLTAEAWVDAYAARYRAAALPIDSYWVCAGTHYELTSLLNDRQVTLLIFTPTPKFSRAHGDFRPDRPAPPDIPVGLENIWVTKTRGSEGPGEIAEPIPGGGRTGVSTVQLANHDITEP